MVITFRLVVSGDFKSMKHAEVVEKILKIEKRRRKKPTEEQIQQAAHSIELMAELAVDMAEKEVKKRRRNNE